MALELNGFKVSFPDAKYFPQCEVPSNTIIKLHCCFVKKVKPLPSYLKHCSLIKGIQPLLCRHQVCWRHERKWSALLILEKALKISPLKTKAYRSNTKVLFLLFLNVRRRKIFDEQQNNFSGLIIPPQTSHRLGKSLLRSQSNINAPGCLASWMTAWSMICLCGSHCIFVSL